MFYADFCTSIVYIIPSNLLYVIYVYPNNDKIYCFISKLIFFNQGNGHRGLMEFKRRTRFFFRITPCVKLPSWQSSQEYQFLALPFILLFIIFRLLIFQNKQMRF